MNQRSKARVRRLVQYAVPLLLLTAAVAAAQPLPHEFSASYVARARGMTLGRAVLELQQDGERYRYTSRMRATGPVGLIFRSRINEASSGTLSEDGLQPHRYDYQRTGSGGREDSVRFDPQAGTAVLHYKGETREQQFEPPAFDPLSLHLALMWDMAEGKREMRYLLTEPRRVRAYRLELTGRERLDTPSGEWDTLRVDLVGERSVEDPADFDLEAAEIPAATDGDRTTFWFAPEISHLPVRIRHIDADDGTLELELEEIRQLKAP